MVTCLYTGDHFYLHFRGRLSNDQALLKNFHKWLLTYYWVCNGAMREKEK